MSTLATTNLKNASSGSNNVVLNADGSVTLGPIDPSSFATTAQMGGVTTTGTITSGGTTLTVASGTGINNGDFVVGTGITPGTKVVSGGGTTSIVVSQAIGATLSSSPVSFYNATKPVSPGLVAGQLCRAWVNFDGTGNGTFAGGTSTVTRVAGSTTATVTTTNNHGLITGNTVYALTGVVAGAYTVTVLTATTFTITTVATTALSAVSITFAVNTIRASYNVSSITDGGVGIYTVNFTTPMPDANYALVVGGNAVSNGSSFTFPIGRLNGTYTANAVDVVQTATGGGGNNADPTIMTVAIFR